MDASTINTPRNRLRRCCAERAATVAALPDELYTAAQVRVLDRRAIAAGTPGIVLMRRAAAAVLAELQCRWPSCKSVLVCCGGGNNGGDGYLFARLAHERGIGVTVLELGQSLVGDAATARQALIADGIQPVALAEVDSFDFASSELIVDALLGTGLTGELRADCADVIARMNAAAVPIISVDLPSGLCSDTGNVVGSVAIEAALTISFIGLKRGLLTSDAAAVTSLSTYTTGIAVPPEPRSTPRSSPCRSGRRRSPPRCPHVFVSASFGGLRVTPSHPTPIGDLSYRYGA
mgnify:CR=1 FL=1